MSHQPPQRLAPRCALYTAPSRLPRQESEYGQQESRTLPSGVRLNLGLGCVLLEGGYVCERERKSTCELCPSSGPLQGAPALGQAPLPTPSLPKGDSAAGLPRFPRENQKTPLPGPPHLLGDSACEHITQRLCAGEGGPRQGTESLPAPPPGPDPLLHPPPWERERGSGGEAADTRPAQSRPVPPSLGEWRGRAWDQLLQPAGQARCRPLPSRLPERRANPRYCAENGDRHLWGAGDALGPHTESGATAPATGREMHERHCCLYD